MRSSRSRTRGSSTIQKAEEQQGTTSTQIDDITERNETMEATEATYKRQFECPFEKLHMDMRDCPDDGSADCPFCVPDARCHMTLEDALETPRLKEEWYEARHKVTPDWEDEWSREELDKLRRKEGYESPNWRASYWDEE